MKNLRNPYRFAWNTWLSKCWPTTSTAISLIFYKALRPTSQHRWARAKKGLFSTQNALFCHILVGHPILRQPLSLWHSCIAIATIRVQQTFSAIPILTIQKLLLVQDVSSQLLNGSSVKICNGFGPMVYYPPSIYRNPYYPMKVSITGLKNHWWSVFLY